MKSKKVKVNYTVFKITATIQIETGYIYDQDTLLEDLKGEFIKVKSGCYENLAFGDINTVELVGTVDNTEEIFS